MGFASVCAWRDEIGADEYQGALDEAKEDAERVTGEFAVSLPADSVAYDAELKTGIGRKGRLIFWFSLGLDLDEYLDFGDYPRGETARATSDRRKRLTGTPVARWNVLVFTVTWRARPTFDDSRRRLGRSWGTVRDRVDGRGSHARVALFALLTVRRSEFGGR